MGVEVHALAYSFNSTDSALANTVFVNYTVLNYSSNTYHDFYLGVYSDIDVGNPSDDFIGCDSTLSLYYGYNGNASDTQYISHIPAQGVLFLSSPMYAFTYFSNSVGNMGDPTISNEYYNVMNGYWKDGTPYTFGGNGYGGTTFTNYVFSGNPLNSGEWSEVSNGSTPGDRRGVGSVGPFVLPAGKSICIDVAFPNAIDYSGDNLSSITLLKQRAADIITFYNSQTYNCGQILLDTTSIPRIYASFNDTTICKGAVITMNNIVVGGVPPYHYQWSTPIGLNNDTLLNPTFTVNQNNIYYITVTDGNNNTDIDTVSVSYFNLYVNIGNDTTYCNNQTVTLTANSGFQYYQWSTGNASQTVNVNNMHNLLGTNIYIVTVTDFNFCTVSDTVALTFLPSPDINLGVDTFMCNTEIITIDAGIGYDNYLWNTGSASNSITIDGSITPLGPAVYWVYVSNNNGCNSSDSIQITNDICERINNVSNSDYMIFPNPVNRGQWLQLKMPEPTDYDLLLTDIYGKEVFEKKINNSDKFSFPTKLFSAGIYFLKIYSEKKSVVYRIVVN